MVLTCISFHKLDVYITNSKSVHLLAITWEKFSNRQVRLYMQDGVAREGLERKSRAFRILLKEAMCGTSGISIKVLEFPLMTHMSTTEETKATTLLHG